MSSVVKSALFHSVFSLILVEDADLWIVLSSSTDGRRSLPCCSRSWWNSLRGRGKRRDGNIQREACDCLNEERNQTLRLFLFSLITYLNNSNTYFSFATHSPSYLFSRVFSSSQCLFLFRWCCHSVRPKVFCSITKENARRRVCILSLFFVLSRTSLFFCFFFAIKRSVSRSVCVFTSVHRRLICMLCSLVTRTSREQTCRNTGTYSPPPAMHIS